MPDHLITILLLGLANMALLIWCRSHVLGTTLIAPWCWAMVTIATVSVSEMLISDQHTGAAQAIRFLAASTSLCPVMAVLGAKRPQSRAWHFVVLTLLLVLALPVGQTLIFATAGQFKPHFAWIGFVQILIGLGFLNWAATRFWISASFVTVGQICLFGRQFQLVSAPQERLMVVMALSSFSVALLLCGRKTPARALQNRFDHVWADFRDLFGAVWGLRIAELINQSARGFQWQVRLTWRGFRPAQPVSTEEEDQIERTMRTQLRRFVSSQWLDRRLDSP